MRALANTTERANRALEAKVVELADKLQTDISTLSAQGDRALELIAEQATNGASTSTQLAVLGNSTITREEFVAALVTMAHNFTVMWSVVTAIAANLTDIQSSVVAVNTSVSDRTAALSESLTSVNASLTVAVSGLDASVSKRIDASALAASTQVAAINESLSARIDQAQFDLTGFMGSVKDAVLAKCGDILGVLHVITGKIDNGFWATSVLNWLYAALAIWTFVKIVNVCVAYRVKAAAKKPAQPAATPVVTRAPPVVAAPEPETAPAVVDAPKPTRIPVRELQSLTPPKKRLTRRTHGRPG